MDWQAKWEPAILALIQYGNLTTAAAAVGIDRVTLWRWTKNRAFIAQWRRTQAQISTPAHQRLKENQLAAADTLVQVMNDPNVSAGTRLRAAEGVLSKSKKFTLDSIDFADFLEVSIPAEYS